MSDKADIHNQLQALISSCIDEGDYDPAEDYIKDPFCRRTLHTASLAIEEIDALRARVAELEADLEICMNALDRLADLTTMGPAIHANICEAGRNEIETRITYADEQRARTAAWQRAGREADAEEAAARAAKLSKCADIVRARLPLAPEIKP